MVAFSGLKNLSGSSKSAVRTDDNLFATDTVELILGLSEGPIGGLEKGASSFEIGDVPLVDEGSGTPNISNFELVVLKGTNPADSIKPNLGGTAASSSVGLELRTQGQQVVHTGSHTQIDYIDLRFTIGRLFAADGKGNEGPAILELKIEVKPHSSAVWQVPFSNEPPPPVADTPTSTNYRPSATQPGTIRNDDYRETYLADTAPIGAKEAGAMWFNTSLPNWRPMTWSGAAWVEPTALVSSMRDGMPVWTWRDPNGSTRVAWYSPESQLPPSGFARGDYLLTPASGEQAYRYNDVAWVGTMDWGKPQVVGPGVLRISGTTRTTYPKEVRIPVARINEPYDIRVTRLSIKEDKTYFGQVLWESYQEVVRDTVSFPDLAVAHLTIKATDTFTQIPDMTGIYEGRIIQVPTNYDPVARTYAGIWDGTFKLAYTNNPGWVAYDLVMNSRYGKNAYYPEVLDKWAVYDFAKHCDLHGFTFNEWITEPRSINETINYVVGLAGGRYVDRGDGFSTILFDADDQPAVTLFSNANVAEGAFTYSFTDITSRKNDYAVSFVNPQLNWREDRLRVFDQDAIDAHGRNPEEFIAVGCTDEEEAVKRGRLRLVTALTEKTMVNFKTNRQGLYIQPFEVILIADEDTSSVITGRLANTAPLPAGTVTLQLRDAIYLEATPGLSITFTVSDNAGGLKVVSYPIAATSVGRVTQIRLDRALTAPLQEKAVFSIGTPKAFRILTIEEPDGEPDNISITAMEVNRLKWAFVDGKVTLRDILKYQTGPLSRFTYPPTEPTVTPELGADGKLSLILNWNRSATPQVGGYRVYQSVNGGRMEAIGEPTDPTLTVQSPAPGIYLFSIVTLTPDRKTESAPATVQFSVAGLGTLRKALPPSNLRLLDEPEAPIFRTVDPRFAWDAAPDPLVDRYLVEVLNGASAVIRSVSQSSLNFSYPLSTNQTDNGGTPLRQFTVRVRSIDTAGNFSDPVSLVVSHPAPAIVPFTLEAVTETVFVKYAPLAGDWTGTLVWLEKSSGFDPLTTQPKSDDKSTLVTLPVEPETVYYVRIAAYDSYGKDPAGLNISSEQQIKSSILLFDPFPPSVPAQPTLATVAEKGLDGTVTSTVTATWPAVVSDNLSHYEIAWQIGSGSWAVRKVDATTATERGFLPGSTIGAKVRSVSKAGVPSDYSPIATVTAAANTAPPANPTDVQLNVSYERVLITLTPPADKDLDYIEVWAAGGTFTDASPVSGAPMIGRIPYGSSFFFDPLTTNGIRTYWLRAVNTSGIPAAGYVRAGTATAPQIQAAALADNIIGATKLASNIAVPTVVAALPTTKVGQFVTLESDGKLYRWDAAQAKYVVDAFDQNQITGLRSDQIAELDGAKVAGQLTQATMGLAQILGTVNGRLTNEQIAGIEAAKLTTKITSTQITDGSITTPLLAAGAVQTNNLAAGAVTASRLSIGSMAANLIPNGDFEEVANGVPVGWGALVPTTTGSTYTAFADSTYSGKTCLLLSKTTTDSASSVATISTRAVIEAGAVYELSMYLASMAGTTAGGFYAVVFWYDGNDTYLSEANVLSSLPVNGVWTRRAASVTAPTNARFARIGLFNASDSTIRYLAVDALAFRRAVGTTLIENGAITTDKLVAGSVTTSKLSVVSANMAYNPDASQGTRGWFAAGTMPGASGVGGPDADPGNATVYAPAGHRAIYIAATTPVSGTVGTYYDLTNRPVDLAGNVTNYPCTAGNVLEFSACLSAHRCTGQIWVGFVNSANAVIAYVNGSTVTDRPAARGTYADFPKSKLIVTAPAGAVGFFVFFRMETLTGADPFLFVSALMIAATTATATETSPYVAPGITFIDGTRIITRTISANRIVADSITASEIAADAIVTRNIKAGAVVTSHMTAGSIDADRLVASSITAAQIAAGAIKADQIAADAITASKLALNGVNLAFNPDLSQGLRGWGRWDGWGGTGMDLSALSAVTMSTDWCPSGFKAAFVTYNKPLAQTNASQAFGLYLTSLDASGNAISHRATAGVTYEFSAFFSLHRCLGRIYVDWVDDTGTWKGNSQQNVTVGGGVGGSARDYPRAGMFAVCPAGATRAQIYFMAHTISGDGPYIFVSGFLMAAAKAGQTTVSPYVAPSTTVIDGGNIFTGSLHANRITAGTITADQIGAGSITVDRLNADQLRARIIATDGLSAASIIVGDNRLSNWVSATDTTRISGGAIAANSIEARSLKISSRNVQLAGVSFQAERDGNNNLTGYFIWTAGHVLYQDANGYPQAKAIPGGRVAMNSAYWYVWFDPRAANFGFAQDNWDAIYNDPEVVLIATVSNYTGISVLVGGTIIDGTRITTGSIFADQIAANAIQARHISGASISGDKIIGGTITGVHIAGTTIEGKHIAASTIGADKIAAGQIQAQHLAVGTGGKNMLWNSDFMSGAVGSSACYGMAQNAGNPAGVLEWYGINGSPAYNPSPATRSLRLSWVNAPQAGAIADIYAGGPSDTGVVDRFPVTGGQRYEATVYISAHRCKGHIIVTFWGPNNEWLGNAEGNVIDNWGAAYQLSAWPRSGLFVNAPANAASASVTFRMTFDGGWNPYTFWACPYFGPAMENQTQYSQWSPGGWTVIDGAGIRASSITADRMNVGYLSAISGNVGDLTAGVIRSPNSKTYFDLTNGRLLISD